ncbi:hypothetical protein D3C76_1860580 [compost metagenome]
MLIHLQGKGLLSAACGLQLCFELQAGEKRGVELHQRAELQARRFLSKAVDGGLEAVRHHRQAF